MITVERQVDGLTKQYWEFIDLGNDLVLNAYMLGEREPKKRKYHPVKVYNRLYSRRSNISEEEVPLPDDVKEEALEIYIKRIRCVKWSQR